jgi:hypothetical protein
VFFVDAKLAGIDVVVVAHQSSSSDAFTT